MIGGVLIAACLAFTLDARHVDETARWQSEIDRVAANGGGLVVIPSGTHEVGQLNLRSGVEIHLSHEAELLGLPGTNRYTQMRLPFSEGDWGAVIFAHGVTNVAITGRGVIDGRGGLWPHSGFRPRGIFFADSANIRLEDFTLRDSANWGVALKRCDTVIVRRITVDNHANDNNDGIDVEARNVTVSDSIFDSGDDAICIKSSDPGYTVENILVSNCVAASHCNGLKLGTASHGTMRNIRFVACRTRSPRRNYLYREGENKGKMAFFWQANDEFPLGIGNGAINVECVDGGTVEDVLFDDIKAEGFRVPIFVRGSLRRRRSNGVPPSSRLVLRGVRIRNVRGTACSEFPSTITGASGCEPKGVLLENVHILCRGDASDGRPVCEPSALYDGFYPDASMFKFLKLPAYGLYIDRADVKCENVRFSLHENAEDRRPAIYTSTPESQAARARLSGFRKSLELTDALAEEGLDEALSSQKWEVVYISVCQRADEVDKAFMARVFTLTEKIRLLAPQAAIFLRKRGTDAAYNGLESSPYGFRTVVDNHRPETWFHLIGGNVSKEGLTADLEAIKAVGFGGIQFFHGETDEIWPGVDEPVRCMSAMWEDVVAHLGRECARLGLTLRLQNCPGWSMSGGPWIDDKHAMRKIVIDGTGRDYRRIGSVAFPSYTGEEDGVQMPTSVETNGDVRVFTFGKDVTLRSLAMPSASCYNHAFSYEPGLRAKLDVWRNGDWVPVFDRAYPRSNYSDKQMTETFSFKPTTGRKWRLEIMHEHPIMPCGSLSSPIFSSAVRLDGWEGKAGWTLREAMPLPDEALSVETTTNVQTIVFGHVNAEKTNHPAPPEATGWECDKLDSKGVEASFEGYLARLLDGPLRNVPVKGVLIDSWECGAPMWTEKMPEYFRRISGYDIMKWLPCLFGHIVESPAATESFLRDWRRTQGELVKEHYYRRFAELAHARGLDVSYETAMGDVIAGDILSYWKYADVPMCEFWSPHDDAAGHVTSYDYKPVRPCVSAAHIYGKPRVAAEAFTSFKLTWNETLADFKREADRFLARGITHLVFHTYTHDPRIGGLPPGSSFNGSIGSPFVRGQSWWRHMPLLTDYLARCEELLESGKPVVDVLWYLGDDCAHKPSEKSPFPVGFKYDYCTFDALSSRASARDGRIVFPDGMSYSVLWVPDGCFVNEASVRRIEELESSGAHVVRGGLVDLEIDLSRLVPDVLFDPSETGGPDDFMWYHRQTPEEDIYFLATSSTNGYHGNVRFRAGGFSSRVAIPPAGSVFVRISQNGGRLEYPSHLQISDCWSKDVVWKQVCLRDCLMETPYFLSPEQTFRTTLAFSASDIQNGIVLDFGDERDVLDVRVNGRRVAKLWCPPYVCMISPMAVVGENEIEVVRTGTWRKRLQYDRSLPVERRKTWTP